MYRRYILLVVQWACNLKDTTWVCNYSVLQYWIHSFLLILILSNNHFAGVRVLCFLLLYKSISTHQLNALKSTLDYQEETIRSKLLVPNKQALPETSGFWRHSFNVVFFLLRLEHNLNLPWWVLFPSLLSFTTFRIRLSCTCYQNFSQNFAVALPYALFRFILIVSLRFTRQLAPTTHRAIIWIIFAVIF